MTKPSAIFLMGPTAAGKTDLALSLVEQGQCEIISVDSAQVFKGMDIGAAKPDAQTLARAPHHLIDIRDPAESYSAVEFRKDALKVMAEITSRGNTPLLTGGTMLYFKTLVEPMADLPPGDESIRKQLQTTFETKGLIPLLVELEQNDPIAFAKIDQKNPQRVQRALEVFRITGKPISSFWAKGVHDGKGSLAQAAVTDFPYRLKQFAVIPNDRKVLHQRIALRFQQMIDQGFEQEVRALYDRGDLHLDLPSMRCVGYRQMWQYFEGELSFDEMIERGVIATRQLAKRQLTWLRGWPNLTVFDTTTGSSDTYAEQILKNEL
ncbi:tRNA (adenosine(37)-N6)-dimethylallyltransferase MiaA [Reinekea sp.]|uniref:tRNA (adenosine(37)-N6)-dimethylallyltransferase MiaA n=2 Tax=Reinekea sp. TaxID=1970455 RepID=UPI003989500C